LRRAPDGPAPAQIAQVIAVDYRVASATPFAVFAMMSATAPGAALHEAGRHGRSLDVTLDGERFVFAVPVLKSSSVPLTLVRHWIAALKPDTASAFNPQPSALSPPAVRHAAVDATIKATAEPVGARARSA